MVGPIPRKTIYAATVIVILALVGGWTIAAGSTTVTGPSQHSSVTVTAPAGFTTAVVQSTPMLTVSDALVTGVFGPAGIQAGPGNGITSAFQNALLGGCGVDTNCNFSAVDSTFGLTQGDTALQVTLSVTQPATTAVGFDVQVEVVYTYNVSTGPTYVASTPQFVFGTGYFDTGAGVLGTIPVALYVDFGVAATTGPSATDVVITMNACQSATVCP